MFSFLSFSVLVVFFHIYIYIEYIFYLSLSTLAFLFHRVHEIVFVFIYLFCKADVVCILLAYIL